MSDNRIIDISPAPPKHAMPSRADLEVHVRDFSFPDPAASRWSLGELCRLIESALLRWPCVTIGHGEIAALVECVRAADRIWSEECDTDTEYAQRIAEFDAARARLTLSHEEKP